LRGDAYVTHIRNDRIKKFKSVKNRKTFTFWIKSEKIAFIEFALVADWQDKRYESRSG